MVEWHLGSQGAQLVTLSPLSEDCAGPQETNRALIKLTLQVSNLISITICNGGGATTQKHTLNPGMKQTWINTCTHCLPKEAAKQKIVFFFL